MRYAIIGDDGKVAGRFLTYGAAKAALASFGTLLEAWHDTEDAQGICSFLQYTVRLENGRFVRSHV